MLTGHNHTSFTVSDVDRSADFYKDVLGFEEKIRFEVQGERISNIVGFPNTHLKIVFVALGDFQIELIEYVSPKGVKIDTATNNVGSAHIAFWTDDVDKTYEELKAKGVKFLAPPQNSKPGRPRVTYFTDPDDNTLEIVQPV